MNTDKRSEPLLPSTSTRKGTNRGIQLYNDFAENNGFVLWDKLTLNYLNAEINHNGELRVKDILRRFAGFVVKPISKVKTKPYYQPDCCAQYLSNLKSALAKK